MKNNTWHGFNQGLWNEEVNVRDFIIKNFEPFSDEPKFLCGPSERTKRVYDKYEVLRQMELSKNGVLDVDTTL